MINNTNMLSWGCSEGKVTTRRVKTTTCVPPGHHCCWLYLPNILSLTLTPCLTHSTPPTIQHINRRNYLVISPSIQASLASYTPSLTVNGILRDFHLWQVTVYWADFSSFIFPWFMTFRICFSNINCGNNRELEWAWSDHQWRANMIQLLFELAECLLRISVQTMRERERELGDGWTQDCSA